MAHDLHFLERLKRVDPQQVDLALALYRDVPLVRFVLGECCPGDAPRVALALAEQDAPHVVVTRAGDFVTCLGPGMTTQDLPVVPFTQIEGACVRLGRQRELTESARERTERLGGISGVTLRIFNAADRFTADDFRAAAALYPLMHTEYFREWLAVGVHLVEMRKRLLPLGRRRARRQDEQPLRYLWQSTWALGHLAVLTALEGDRFIDVLTPEQADVYTRVFSWPCTSQGLFGPFLRGVWATAKVGKRLVAPYRNALQEPLSHTRALDLGFGLAAIGLRHQRLRAECLKALEGAAKLRTPDPRSAGFFGFLRDELQNPKDPAEAEVLARNLSGLLLATLRGVHNPSREHIEAHAAHVTPGFALLMIGDVRTEERVALLALALLPWVARAEADELFCGPELLSEIPQWTTEDSRWLLAEQSTVAGVAEPFVRAAPKVSRNAPCPCESGRKYKACCGRGAGAAP